MVQDFREVILADGLAAEYSFLDSATNTPLEPNVPPSSWVIDGFRLYLVTIKNIGTERWTPGLPDLRVHFGEEGAVPDSTWWSFLVAEDVEPGQETIVTVFVKAPNSPGRYVLHHRMVKDGLTMSWSNEASKTWVQVSIAATIDPIDFFRRIAAEKTLQGKEMNSIEGNRPEAEFQSYVEPYSRRSYYVKNVVPRSGKDERRYYERHQTEDDFVVLERDTSWPPPAPADAYDTNRRWVKTRQWTVGENFQNDVTLKTWKFKTEPMCQHGSVPRNEFLFLEAYESRNYGGDLNEQESIAVLVVEWKAGGFRPEERFWYARDYGWVEWQDLIDPNGLHPRDEKHPTSLYNNKRWNMFPGELSGISRLEVIEPEYKCPQLATEEYEAEYYFIDDSTNKLVSSPPTNWVVGEQRSYAVKVKNTGQVEWPMQGPNAMRLAITFSHFLAIPPRDDGPRFVLPGDHILPGESATRTVTVTAPATNGLYLLRHRMVQGD